MTDPISRTGNNTKRSCNVGVYSLQVRQQHKRSCNVGVYSLQVRFGFRRRGGAKRQGLCRCRAASTCSHGGDKATTVHGVYTAARPAGQVETCPVTLAARPPPALSPPPGQLPRRRVLILVQPPRRWVLQRSCRRVLTLVQPPGCWVLQRSCRWVLPLVQPPRRWVLQRSCRRAPQGAASEMKTPGPGAGGWQRRPWTGRPSR